MAWTLDAKLLDAHVEALEETSIESALRRFRACRLPNGGLDVHASTFARAYRVTDGSGKRACLRFWMADPHPSLTGIYMALVREPGLLKRSKLPWVQLFERSMEVGGQVIPAVLMKWSSGVPLGQSIDSSANNPSRLLSLGEALRSRFVELNDAGVSHGDLRASNVIVQMKGGSPRVELIDLDSLRWRGGPSIPRVVGGNLVWQNVYSRFRVDPLAADYLDQAMLYLTIVAVAESPARWKGSTDGFLMLGQLKADAEDVLTTLGRMQGPPATIASVVRRVMNGLGSWEDLPDALAGRQLRNDVGEGAFWGSVFSRPVSPNTVAKPVESTQQEQAAAPPPSPQAQTQQQRQAPPASSASQSVKGGTHEEHLRVIAFRWLAFWIAIVLLAVLARMLWQQ